VRDDAAQSLENVITSLPSPCPLGSHGVNDRSPIHAVLFDFGGVITTSPFEAFNRYEAEIGVPLDTVRTINSTNPDDNAWAKMERSEVSLDEFAELFETEARALGHEMSGKAVLACLSGDVRPQMVRALDILRERQIRIGCITNNMRSGHGAGMARTEDQAARVADAMSRFEVVIESSKVGLRKPDPRIYELACSQMGIEPTHAAYLDDLGINCKPARALGMATVKVGDPDVALDELEGIVGFALR
jgi:putative hydrolase of the HAD superfamily